MKNLILFLTIAVQAAAITFPLDTTATTDWNGIIIYTGPQQQASEFITQIQGATSIVRWRDDFQGWEQYYPALTSTDFTITPPEQLLVNVSIPGEFNADLVIIQPPEYGPGIHDLIWTGPDTDTKQIPGKITEWDVDRQEWTAAGKVYIGGIFQIYIKAGIKISPNPTRVGFIKTEKIGPEARIYNILGQAVQFTRTGDRFDFDLPAGKYFLKSRDHIEAFTVIK